MPILYEGGDSCFINYLFHSIDSKCVQSMIKVLKKSKKTYEIIKVPTISLFVSDGYKSLRLFEHKIFFRNYLIVFFKCCYETIDRKISPILGDIIE